MIISWFDLTNAGAKRETASYHKIAGAIEVSDERILCLFDHPDELDADATAG
ncbi:hypothetical protein ABFA25_13135 [Mycobacterium lepromatosis]|uniref:hypothetical protein n=1 Tax=Mycobacterium lepromatosis TaxID=480418 RepID=UPI003D805F7C